jgi:hypoxanthine phosphoribosyltransferase
MMPDVKEVLITSDQIEAKVREIGARITEDYKGEKPLLVGVLRGAVVIMSDLMRNIDLQCELDFMDISSYGSGSSSSGVVRILKDLEEDITDRHVLIVEDIIDTGLTLSYLMRSLHARKPASLEVCALLSKPSRRRDTGSTTRGPTVTSLTSASSSPRSSTQTRAFRPRDSVFAEVLPGRVPFGAQVV